MEQTDWPLHRTSDPFRWVAGVEGSIIPHLDIDQYRWTQHDHFWREDFDLAASLKCSWLRYSLPWAALQPEPGIWNWTWCDERFEKAASSGIRLIVDLVHFGVPTWLPDAFGDVSFPEALETFAREFGRRYRGHPAVASICPINEPLTTAFFAGDAGLWPPHGRGLPNYMVILSRLSQALTRAIKALRETMGEVEIILCDSLEVAKTDEPDSSEKTSPHLTESLGADVARRMERRHIVMDLVLGRVNARHPLYTWLLQYGFPVYDLNWFLKNPQRIDVIGLDYYYHTEVELYTSQDGYYRQRPAKKPYGLYLAAQAYWHRYQLPFMVTETSLAGRSADKIAWLQKCVKSVRRLRADGIPCIGFTWWPLIDHIDWDGAMLHQTGHIHPVGIYSLRRSQSGELVREPTDLTNTYRDLIEQGDGAVGPIVWRRTLFRINRKQVASVPRELRVTQPPVVIYSPSRWLGHRSRLHHLALQWAMNRQVLFIEPATSSFNSQGDASSITAVDNHPSLQIFKSTLTAADSVSERASLLLERLAAEGAQSGFPFHEASHWVQDPSLGLTVRERFPGMPIVFDALENDDFGLSGAVYELGKVANALVFRSQIQMARLASHSQRPSYFVPDGVDARHFLRATKPKTEVPHDSKFISRPVLAYFGEVDERLDLRLIERLAEETLDWNLLIVGPVSNISPESLPRLGNIYWLGPRRYEQLPSYLSGVDACILPFRRTPFTNGYMPPQTYEMLCSGRLVIATNLPELTKRNLDGVHIAKSGADFLRACHRAVLPLPAARRHQVIRGVVSRTWRQVSREASKVLEASAPIRHGL